MDSVRGSGDVADPAVEWARAATERDWLTAGLAGARGSSVKHTNPEQRSTLSIRSCWNPLLNQLTETECGTLSAAPILIPFIVYSDLFCTPRLCLKQRHYYLAKQTLSTAVKLNM